MLGNKSRTGQKQSFEERLKKSLSLKGRPSPMKGKKHSEETKIKIRQSGKGRIVTLDTRQKMSLAHKGTKPSKKAIKASVDSRKGKKPWNWKGGLSKEERAGRPKPTTCEVCGGGGVICFDHDHITGKFRGWICGHCNFTLGHARDNVEVLYKLINYLNLK